MNPAILKQLIDKYFDGETSLEEEQQLREFFKQEDLSGAYTELKAYFIVSDEFSEETLSAGFDEMLDKKLMAESDSGKRKMTTYWISGIAASLLLFLSIWLGTELFQPKEVYGTITDPKIAFMETKKVLGDVSQKLNEGLKPARKTTGKVKKNIEQAGEITKVNQAFKKSESLNKLDEASDLLKSFSKVTIITGNS
jgi:hypothetical protein